MSSKEGVHGGRQLGGRAGLASRSVASVPGAEAATGGVALASASPALAPRRHSRAVTPSKLAHTRGGSCVPARGRGARLGPSSTARRALSPPRRGARLGPSSAAQQRRSSGPFLCYARVTQYYTPHPRQTHLLSVVGGRVTISGEGRLGRQDPRRCTRSSTRGRRDRSHTVGLIATHSALIRHNTVQHHCTVGLLEPGSRMLVARCCAAGTVRCPPAG